MNIGVFDSGFGGIDVLVGIRERLPDYNYIYLGDNARVPYGNKGQEVILQYTKEALSFLFSQDCALVILACNTASAKALRTIQQEWLPVYHPDKKVLGVIIPAAEYAATSTKNKQVGVLATESTVTSGTYVQEIKKLDPEIKVFQYACPLFVPLIEHGEDRDEIWESYIKQYLDPVINDTVDTLILGCTHYGIIKDRINSFFSKHPEKTQPQIIHQSSVVGTSLQDYLTRHKNLEQTLTRDSAVSYFVTDEQPRFSTLAKKYFDIDAEPQKISLDPVK